jgi:hypothetical protein
MISLPATALAEGVSLIFWDCDTKTVTVVVDFEPAANLDVKWSFLIDVRREAAFRGELRAVRRRVAEAAQ